MPQQNCLKADGLNLKPKIQWKYEDVEISWNLISFQKEFICY